MSPDYEEVAVLREACIALKWENQNLQDDKARAWDRVEHGDKRAASLEADLLALQAKFAELKAGKLDGTMEVVMDNVSMSGGLVTFGDFAVAVRRFLVENFEEV